jgi:hypothetical protein
MQTRYTLVRCKGVEKMTSHVFGLPLREGHLYLSLTTTNPIEIGQEFELKGIIYEVYDVKTSPDIQYVYVKETGVIT